MGPDRTSPASASSSPSATPSDSEHAALDGGGAVLPPAGRPRSSELGRGGTGKPAGGAGAVRAAAGSPFVAVAWSVLAHVGVIGALIAVTGRDRAGEQEGRPARIAVPPIQEFAPDVARVEDLVPEEWPALESRAPRFDEPSAVEPVDRAEPDPVDEAPADEGSVPRFDDRFAPEPTASLGGEPFVPPREPAFEEVLDPDEPVRVDELAPAVEPPAIEEESAPQVESDDEAPPELLDAPPPAYPKLARRRGWEGSVLLELVVAADGRVVEAAVLESSGRDLLDDAACDAVLTWRFVAGAAGRSARHRVTFTLD